MFQSEFLKIRKSSIWLLIFVSPLLATVAGFAEPIVKNEGQWAFTLSLMTFVHALLFLPLLAGVFSAFVCRYEHIGGGWKQMLSMPVSRHHIYIVKFGIVIGLLFLTQLLFLVGLLFIGEVRGFSGDIPWKMVLISVMGGWIATMPIAALQMLVSVAWSSFAAPLAINVILTLPNILVVNSAKYGPVYPWAQPFLAMIPHRGDAYFALNISVETLFFVILGSLCVFFLSGIIYFQKKEA
ncbi:ABC transporter permease [Cytobacillus sp. Hz8]|uniref:ABC transporter permease n=1 Tax=Cytobacillus sp. Hz8 TaxID=3347168 RepID=UPI0035DCCCA4